MGAPLAETIGLLVIVAGVCAGLGFWAGREWHRDVPRFDGERAHADAWDREVTADLRPAAPPSGDPYVWQLPPAGLAYRGSTVTSETWARPGWAPPGPAVTTADPVTFWTPPSVARRQAGPEPDLDPLAGQACSCGNLAGDCDGDHASEPEDPLALLDAPPDRLAAPAEIADAARYRLDWGELDRQQADARLWYDREFQTGQFKAAPKKIGEHE
jgi:hypothetical protein